MAEPERAIGLHYVKHGRISVITLDRPGKANALSIAQQAEIARRVGTGGPTEEFDAVVIHGGDGAVFCAGADTNEGDPSMTPEEFAELRSSGMFDLLDAIVSSPIPVVAAVNGHAVGSGCMLALIADAAVVTGNATFSLPEIKLGRPTFAGLSVVTFRAGATLAARMAQTGERIGARDAIAAGLGLACNDQRSLLDEAIRIAGQMAAHPNAFAANKKWLNAGLLRDLARARGQSREMRRQGAGAATAVTPDSSNRDQTTDTGKAHRNA